jgi:DNA-binding response OmpR family regulator/signal transduction histidine kinase
MNSSIESKYDRATGGLWIEENAASFVQHQKRLIEDIPVGFTSEYTILAEVCASMSSGFMLLNKKERVSYSNERALRLLHINRQEQISLLDFDIRQYLLSIAADPQQATVALEQVWSHPEQEYGTEVALVDAAAKWLRVRSFPVWNESGTLLGRGMLLDDITLEHSAIESRAETLSMAAHELKTPLAIIKGCATTLLGGSARWDPSMQHEMLQMIDSQSDRLYDVLNTLLDVWRFDAGMQSLRLTQVQITELLLQLLQRWQKQASTHRFVLDVPKEEVPPVLCDALRIEQVLNHLLNNAVTYSAAGSLIRVMIELHEVDVRINVSDEGRGIAADHLDRIFDRFYRIEQEQSEVATTSTPQQSGSGLGLAAARATIEAHRGKIWADSPGLGQGSTFSFVLPYSQRVAPTKPLAGTVVCVYTAVQPAGQNNVRMSALKQDRRMRVLLAECDARLARYLRANLEEQQYRVQTVNHGIQLLRQMDLEEPDVILLATRLSDMSGVDLLQRIREFSNIPVLMLSDACDEEERVQLLDLGCDDLMLKPFGMKELLARVRALLRRQLPPVEHTQNQSVFVNGDLVIDYAQHLVTICDKPVQLSRTEYKLLSTLAQNVGLVVTHELLLEKVWGPEYNRDIDFIWVYISRLRRKVEKNSRRPEYILTVPDVGYKLAKL